VSILWIVSKSENGILIKMLWPTGFSILLLAVDEFIYFFPMAVLFSVVAAALVFISIFKLKKAGE
jgi:hypothetical protein